jgi:hypothetical protein
LVFFGIIFFFFHFLINFVIILSYNILQLKALEKWKIVCIGFGGLYIQISFLIFTCYFTPVFYALFGKNWKNIVLFFQTWGFIYLVFYAIHFFDDCHSDFSFFVNHGLEECLPKMTSIDDEFCH